MAKTTTSLRLDDELRKKLSELARREGMTITALVERTLREGLAIEEHPGIIFNDGPSGRRAAVVGCGADVWEIISTWRYLEGSEEERTAALIEDYHLTRWQINTALDYAAAHRDEIEARIKANEIAWQEMERLAAERERLLA